MAFQSEKGFCVLDRGLQTQFIGEQIQDFVGKYPTSTMVVTSGVLVPSESEVRWTLDDTPYSWTTLKGVRWNYHLNTWSRQTNLTGTIHATIVGGLYHTIGTTLAYKDNSAYTGNYSHVMDVTTGWFKFAGLQGFKRIYRTVLLIRHYGGGLRVRTYNNYSGTATDDNTWSRTPAWAAKETLIPAGQIIRVARAMGKAAPKVAVCMGPGVAMNPRGTYAAMAVHSLNGLLGSIDVEGGVWQSSSVPLGKFASADKYVDEQAKNASKGKKFDGRGAKDMPAMMNARPGSGVVTNNVANGMLKDPGAVKVFMASWSNFNFSCTGADRWDKAMAKVPFFVHMVTNPSEMTVTGASSASPQAGDRGEPGETTTMATWVT